MPEDASGGMAPAISGPPIPDAADRRARLRALLHDPAARPRVASMSFAQRRLWFLDQLVPGNPFYNVDAAIRLRGVLDGTALRAALQEIVDRHGALRTTFARFGDRPVQLVHPRLMLKMPETDLSALPEPSRTDAALSALRALARQPFDLARGPLIRCALLRLSSEDHVLSVTLHHIVSDGWSMGVLMHEVSTLYSTFRRGQPSPLPALPIQYADFADRQIARLGDAAIQRQMEYWRAALAGLTHLELPTDRPRPATPSFSGGRTHFEIDAAASDALRALCRAEGATLFMVLLAAFQVLLHRWSGADDIAIGTPIAGRDRADVEGLIGFFVNTLVIRGRVDEGLTFRDLVGRVRGTTLDAFAHRELPFERLVEELQPERDASRNPLCQVIFALQNAPTTPLALDGLATSFPGVSNDTARFDLVLDVWEPQGRPELAARLEYACDLFDAATIEAMGRQFTALLRAAAAAPDTPVGALPLAGPAEHAELLRLAQGDANPLPADRLVHDDVARHASEAPWRMAVADAKGTLTYGELLARADGLATRLAALGVGPGTLAAICLEPCRDWVATQLAVLRTGAAYVALDPAYPPARLARMLRDSRPAALLTRNGLEHIAASGEAMELLLVDGPDATVGSAPARPSIGAADPAYVVYTSGSTGTPNGVVIEHRGLSNLVAWHQRTYRLQPDDRTSQIAGPGFDASVWEVWPTLAAGASLHIAPAPIRRDGPALLAWMAEHRIDIAFLPTPLAEAALAAPMPADLGLRALLTGGDRLRLGGVPARLPFQLVNHYGPSECTVVATAADLGDLHASAEAMPPIGRPIDNTQCHVLDAHGAPSPPRVPGELYIGGLGLARGYLGQPSLTAARFVANPFGPGRLYRTGDRARWRADGQLEFLGRVDDQASIRGIRVEPAEVEALLSRHPEVTACVVLARPDMHGATRLVAYIVPGARADRLHAASEAQIEHWRRLYEETYGEDAAADPAFDTTGWRSSYTGLPIAAEEMRAWVDGTVARVLALRPSRILEIGCGTGLLLHRIAPHCSSYVGLDFSAGALAKLAPSVAARGLSHVALVEGRADDLRGVPQGAFDLVILNSIVQYFADEHMLVRVLEGALARTTPGGAIFVGDVRSLPLLHAFHLSVELHRAPADLPAAELLRRAERAAQQEGELLLAPAWFQALAARDGRITETEIQPREGRGRDEMTRFRYDVVLRTGHSSGATPWPWLDWVADGLSVQRLAALLRTRQPECLAIRGVPNARLDREVATAALLASPEPPRTAGDLRRLLAEPGATRAPQGLDPTAAVAVAEREGYEGEASWKDSGQAGEYLLRLRRRRPPASDIPIDTGDDALNWAFSLSFRSPTLLSRQPEGPHANEPLGSRLRRELVPRLRASLREQVPEAMVPSAFVVLDALPITPNGKVDRSALPEPPPPHPEFEDRWAAPATPMEALVAAIWSELLGVERVGRHDNFFDLGGHSLLATQIVARLREQLRVEVPVRLLFDHPTIAALASQLAKAAAIGVGAG